MTPTKFIVPPSICICGDPNCKIPYGLCHCGCKKQTVISNRSSSRDGCRINCPKMFVHGHHSRKKRPDLSEAVPFKIDGEYCRLIPLTQGQFTIVLAVHYDWLSQFDWYARWCTSTRSFYAGRTVYHGNGKFTHIGMHKEIIGLSERTIAITDHINGITLDNRLDNLRPVDQFRSSINRSTRRDNTSGRKGVSWNQSARKWQVTISYMGKQIYLGRYSSFEVACSVREAAEKKYHGEYARKE